MHQYHKVLVMIYIDIILNVNITLAHQDLNRYSVRVIALFLQGHNNFT